MSRLSRIAENLNELYHGSHEDFEEFDLNRFGRVDNGYLGRGIYFFHGSGGELTPQEALDESNYYGPNIYQVKLEGAKIFNLPLDAIDAREALSVLPEYADLKPNLEIPEGYFLQENPPDPHAWSEVGRTKTTYSVSPKPEKYDDPNVVYGQKRVDPKYAIDDFNAELNKGFSHGSSSWDSYSVLRNDIDRDTLHEVMLKNGYNVLKSGGEVVVYDPSIIKMDKKSQKELETGFYY